MLRISHAWLLKGGPTTHRDTSKYPRLVREVGSWLYNKETMQRFQQWCRKHQVRAYGNIKITSTIHFARCLRAARLIYPGQAILTCPSSACFNFLTVAREIYDCDSTAFPVQLNWMNYRDRLSFLRSTSTAELAMAGWMARIHSMEDSEFTPYIKYLLEDTRGRDGVANGITKEREEDSGLLDHYFSEIATDACEDPEVLLENLFRAFACVHLRTQPIEEDAIASFIPGTNFFKAKAAQMHVPTLMPLIDAVPQLEDESHNTVVQYFPYTTMDALRAQCEELGIRFFERGAEPIVTAERRTAFGVERTVNTDHELMDPALLRGGGFFALRAIRPVEEGDVLYLRAFSEAGKYEQSKMNSQVLEANRLMSNDN